MNLTNEQTFELDSVFTARPYQEAIFTAIEEEGYKRALLVWPRRAGKDITLWHLMLRQALKRVGQYFYCLPTYSQCRSVIWNAIRTDEIKFQDMIPEGLISKKNSSDMSITLKNGSRMQLIGSDAYDRSLVGSNPIGIIFSEFSRADINAFRYSTPILQGNDGWCVINSTPYGHNHFYELFNIAKSNPNEWFCQRLTIDDTRHISLGAIQAEINSGVISEDLAKQEYWTSFDMGVEGSYFAKYVSKMILNGQIGNVPYESHLKTHTFWDIGVRDSTVVLFAQVCGATVRIFDCLEGSKQGLDYYCKELQARGYNYGRHFGPHDIKVQEFGSGLTRLEQAENLGIHFDVVPQVPLMDGIECVRASLGRIWIDDIKCKKLVSALENYRQEYDTKYNVYKPRPLHDNHSHWADAMRYLCLSIKNIGPDTTADELDDRYKKAMTKGTMDYGPFTQHRF